ncbi:hypothetical protein PPL_09390 [Heterostelium album PN500]|uniref:Uncharacterized protein n=1 Tax=Heterostelium pallidum (strain ATCC 26659 / Pp 5 / PN500) TaxID=670386 RepID=D3BLF6_HETP5|nr:hypothetical protein PPL_09390 [Heterostelium album PN500]EFA77890.1 hypothetical protein PPL_09390 [Heterostelium album PN500]|eukprot:XP_020430018.1 hypothetical protein PPL_09390 [Heterostelium album PN500]
MEDIKICNISTFVRIYVWNSSLNGGDGVGHVALETNNIYASLWPGDAVPETKREQLLKVRAPHLMRDYNDDRLAEATSDGSPRNAEVVVTLYSLDASKLEHRFEHYKKTLKGWTLAAGTFFRNDEKAESCASLAFRLLESAGLRDLVNEVHHSSITASSAVTPDLIARLVVLAKKAELSKFPETRDFKHINDTFINQSTANVKSNCIIIPTNNK